MPNRHLPLSLVLMILTGCGGNSQTNNAGDTAPDNTPDQAVTASDVPASLDQLEQVLSRSTQADGSNIDGIWLLAQERITQPNQSASGSIYASPVPEYLFRSDVITLQRSGNLIIARYCANGAKPLFEGILTDNQYFEIQGDGYFLPSRDNYRGHLTGDGTRIEFSPDHFDNPSKGAGQVSLRAYKLTELTNIKPLGHWQTPAGSLAIDCITVIETHTYGADQNINSRHRQFNFSSANATLAIQQRLEKNNGSSFQLTEVIDEKNTWTGEQLLNETLDMYSPIRYQGSYQPPDKPARTFAIHLRSY